MRDPVYDGEVPMESEEDWENAERAATMDICAEHEPELVQDSLLRANRIWRCAKCFEPMYEVDA